MEESVLGERGTSAEIAAKPGKVVHIVQYINKEKGRLRKVKRRRRRGRDNVRFHAIS